MANDMVTRCARAMFDAMFNDKDSDAYMHEGDVDRLDNVAIDGHVNLFLAARAMLEAMREPTPEMVRVGTWDVSTNANESEVYDSYVAMISAALSQEDRE